MLTPLRTALGRTLRWTRPSIWRRAYELRAGTDRVATLTVTGLFGHRAVGEVNEDRWVLSARGLFHQRVVVTHGDSDVEVASARSRLFGEGVMRIEPGRTFDWKPDNFWRTRWTLGTKPARRSSISSNGSFGFPGVPRCPWSPPPRSSRSFPCSCSWVGTRSSCTIGSKPADPRPIAPPGAGTQPSPVV